MGGMSPHESRLLRDGGVFPPVTPDPPPPPGQEEIVVPDVVIRSEEKAKEKGLKTRVQVNDMLSWFSARTFAETVAWSKIIVEEATDRIVGAHFVGHSGEELINLFGLAMQHGITASQIRDFVFAYPTFSADIKSML